MSKNYLNYIKLYFFYFTISIAQATDRHNDQQIDTDINLAISKTNANLNVLKLNWDVNFSNAEGMKKFKELLIPEITDLTLIKFPTKEIIFDAIGKKLSNLRRLDLRLSPAINNDMLFYLSGLQHLEDLNLDAYNLTSKGISYLKNYTTLKSLVIKGIPDVDETLNSFNLCTQMELLDLPINLKKVIHDPFNQSSHKITQNLENNIPISLSNIKNFPNLRIIYLSNRIFKEEVPATLKNLVNLTKLKELYLDGTNIQNNDLQFIGFLPQLEILDLRYTEILAKDLYQAALEERFKNLENIYLSMVDLKEIFKLLNNPNYNNHRDWGKLFQNAQDNYNYILNGIKLKKTTIDSNGINLELFINSQSNSYSRNQKSIDLKAINLQDYLSKGILFEYTVSFLKPFKKLKFVSFDVISYKKDLTKPSCDQAILKYYEEKSGILSSQLKHYGTLGIDDNDRYQVETSYKIPLIDLLKYYENCTGVQFEVDYIDS